MHFGCKQNPAFGPAVRLAVVLIMPDRQGPIKTLCQARTNKLEFENKYIHKCCAAQFLIHIT